jgi:hypothetical protein
MEELSLPGARGACSAIRSNISTRAISGIEARIARDSIGSALFFSPWRESKKN